MWPGESGHHFRGLHPLQRQAGQCNALQDQVLSHWLRCLRRRSQRHRLTWRKMMRIAERWLPSPKLRHPYPDWRFDVMIRGGSPVR